MDLLSLAPYAGLFGSLATAVFFALKFNREDAGQVVEQQSTILKNASDLNQHLQDEIQRLQATLNKTREERDRLERELAQSTTVNRQLEENLRVCIMEQNRLERKLIELGEDPGHAEV